MTAYENWINRKAHKCSVCAKLTYDRCYKCKKWVCRKHSYWFQGLYCKVCFG